MYGWFFISLLALVGIALFGFFRDRWRRKKRENARNQFHFFLAAGVLVSAAILIFPIQLKRLEKTNAYGFQATISSIVYAMQLFTLNVEYKELPWFVENFQQSGWAAAACAALLTAEFVAAPLLTFTIVISFFRNVYAWFRRLVLFRQDTHVFSEMNERSLVLAESIHKKDKKACLIFTDVKADEEDIPEYMINRARKIKAVWYKQDILSVNLSGSNKKKQLALYLIKEEKETENIVQAMELIERFRERENCKLYVFSTRPECEYLLNKKKGQKITARRINDAVSLVNRTLFDSGCEMLYDAATDGIPRRISVVLIGLGRHGMEMLKALAWYCQMYGYKLEINAFDKDPNVLNQLSMTCGSLLENQDFQCRRESRAGHEYEPGYQINVYPDTDTESPEFVRKLENIEDPAYILVALGDDENNIRTAVNIRMIYERINAEREKNKPAEKDQVEGSSVQEEERKKDKGAEEKPPKRPKIQAIVYNSKECRILKDLANFKNEKYEIDFIGDVGSSFTQDVLINSELEEIAKKVHMDYNNGKEEGFYDYEYNYRSSCASAIHIRAVAWQLKNVIIDAGLLKQVESWLIEAFHLSSSRQNSQLVSWAKGLTRLANEMSELEDFSLKEWKAIPRTAEETKIIRQAETDLQNLFKECKTYSTMLEAYNPEQVARHLLLVVKLMKLEHERWSAYMRAEGYRYDRKKSDLGKMHDDLIRFEKLPDEEKAKDLHVELLIGQKNMLYQNKTM